MSQERLSGLAIMSINHDEGKCMSYDDVIDDFALRKCRGGMSELKSYHQNIQMFTHLGT